MRFLIDECLTVDLVTTAHTAGHGAEHIARVGKGGWKDWNVAGYARDHDLTLVTNNATDFRKIYADQPLHAGLIILIPSIDRRSQQALFKAVLDELALLGEPVNQVIEVDLDGDDAVFTVYDLSASMN